MSTTSYANQATKQIIVSLSGAKGFAETLIQSEYYRGKAVADEYLRIVSENIQLALNAICDGLDGDQLSGLMRYAKNVELQLVPKHSPQTQREEFIVQRDDLEALLKNATGDCAFCELEGNEIKRCPIRKALFASGVIPAGTKDCPYKG